MEHEIGLAAPHAASKNPKASTASLAVGKICFGYNKREKRRVSVALVGDDEGEGYGSDRNGQLGLLLSLTFRIRS